MSYRYLFGPVPSRRLGRSLGVDLVPYKTYSFNCVYCECGRTTRLTNERAEYVPTSEVLAELKKKSAGTDVAGKFYDSRHHRQPGSYRKNKKIAEWNQGGMSVTVIHLK